VAFSYDIHVYLADNVFKYCCDFKTKLSNFTSNHFLNLNLSVSEYRYEGIFNCNIGLFNLISYSIHSGSIKGS